MWSFSSYNTGSKKCDVSIGKRTGNWIQIFYMHVGIDAVRSILHLQATSAYLRKIVVGDIMKQSSFFWWDAVSTSRVH